MPRKPDPRGRPRTAPDGEARTERVEVRLSPREARYVRREAGREGIKLAEWIRRRMRIPVGSRARAKP